MYSELLGLAQGTGGVLNGKVKNKREMEGNTIFWIFCTVR